MSISELTTFYQKHLCIFCQHALTPDELAALPSWVNPMRFVHANVKPRPKEQPEVVAAPVAAADDDDEVADDSDDEEECGLDFVAVDEDREVVDEETEFVEEAALE